MANKRGRPKKVFSGHFFGAPLLALSVYNQQKANDQKHSIAIDEAVKAVNVKYPEYPFRGPEMRKLLAKAQPSDFPFRLKVTEEAPSDEDHAQAERLGFKPAAQWKKLTLSIAPAIKYKRSNAKGPKKKRTY